MERPLCYLSDESLDVLLSRALSIVWKIGDIEDGMRDAPLAVLMLVREYADRHERPKVRRKR